jgi:acyl carrier protein
MFPVSEMIALVSLILFVLLIPCLRKVRASALDRKNASALKWAARYYPDQNRRKIAARVALLLESQIHVPISQFAPSTNFVDDLMMDDLEPVEVLMAVEAEFGIEEIDRAEAEKMLVIDDLVQYLVSKFPA